MKHPLNFVGKKGLLADALGISPGDPQLKQIERMVESATATNQNIRELFVAVGELDISDELWANFLYTFGYWQGGYRSNDPSQA
jgi:hypothetical protein